MQVFLSQIVCRDCSILALVYRVNYTYIERRVGMICLRSEARSGHGNDNKVILEQVIIWVCV